MRSDNQDECQATPAGLMQCLGMLAEEAAVLHLPRTLRALREALLECQSELQAGRLAVSFQAAPAMH